MKAQQSGLSVGPSCRRLAAGGCPVWYPGVIKDVNARGATPRKRVQFGQAITQNQTIGHTLADIQTRLKVPVCWCITQRARARPRIPAFQRHRPIVFTAEGENKSERLESVVDPNRSHKVTTNRSRLAITFIGASG